MKSILLYAYGFCVLLPLCWINFYRRTRGTIPDEWYWADTRLCQIGIRTRWPWRWIVRMPRRDWLPGRAR